MVGEGIIEIGENSYIGRFSNLQVSYENKIKLGKNCRIGPFFSIWTESADVDSDFMNFVSPKKGDVLIGDGVWIGTHVIISPGVIVGNNSIIGANSVVTKDVPPNAIFGGVPAKLIRYKKFNS